MIYKTTVQPLNSKDVKPPAPGYRIVRVEHIFEPVFREGKVAGCYDHASISGCVKTGAYWILWEKVCT